MTISLVSSLAAVFLTACGGGGGLSTSAGASAVSQTVSQTAQDSCVAPAGGVCIGAAGGVVTGPGGASLQIPAGAIKSSQTFSILQTADGSPVQPIGTSAAGAVWQVLPHGVSFDVTATLTLPYDAAAMVAAGHAGELPWLYKAQPGGSYTRQTGVSAAAAGMLQIGLNSLSYFSARTNKAPIAQIASNIIPASIVTGQEIVLNPAASSDSDGTITSYRWSLADGTSTTIITNASATQSIYSFTTPGLRTATLLVTDNQGATNSYALSISVQSYSATGALNDTGQDWCSENISTPSTWVNNAVCSTYNWVGNLWGTMQDAFTGRDAQATAGTLTKVGTGMAGFDFTRIGANGQPLAIQTATYSATGNETAGTRWDCIRDNVTGMYWEIKRKNDPTHLRHYTATFGWYNPDAATNGGDAGYEGIPYNYDIDAPLPNSCNGVANLNKCNTQAYRIAINAMPSGQALCGFRDWRLPSKDELLTITNLGRNQPAIDSNHFPDVNLPAPFYGVAWSSSSFSGSPAYAWYVYFDYGGDGNYYKRYAFSVRLVRSGQ